MGYLLLKSPKELASENSRKHVFCIFEFLTVYTFFFRTGRHYVAKYRGVQDSVGIRHKLVRGHFTSGCAAGAERDIPLFLQADAYQIP